MNPPSDAVELVNKAEREGFMLEGYGELWFTPKELRAEWNAGKFLWSAVNWKLRRPAERLRQLETNRDLAQANIELLRQRVAKQGWVGPWERGE